MATPDTTQSLTDEISSSLAAVWKRYTTKRPEGATTVIEGNVVRCVLPGSARDFAACLELGAEEGETPAGRLRSYRRHAAKAVSSLTHCRVLAVISEHDEETDVATEIFVLEGSAKTPAFGEPGWIVS